jgi:hypothetical protein
MKKLSLLFCIICIAALTGCDGLGNKNKVRGSGTAKTETRELAPFTAVEVQCFGTINVTAQGQRSVEISSDDNIVPLITTEVKGNTLYISSTTDYEPKSKMQINVVTPELEKFVFAGAGDVTLAKIKNNRMEVAVSGAGRLTASGETKEADITLSGAGSVDAKDLLADKTRANSTGVGMMEVYAREQLDANTSGVGNISYYGNPKSVNKHVGGIGTIAPK